MPFDSILAATRFGMGLSPDIAPPGAIGDMLDPLSGPDVMAAAFPIPPYAQAQPSELAMDDARRAQRRAVTDEARAAAELEGAAMQDAAREGRLNGIRMELCRAVWSPTPLRERLTRFWADHFTVRSFSGVFHHLVSPYIEEAIRPHIAGPFAAMLQAVIRSPLMLYYLDQHKSIGPNSPAATRGRGLNENFAREMLELHTLGSGGAYSQTDVRQLAELLTGVTSTTREGPHFNPQQAEPGPETILGRTYDGPENSYAHVDQAMADLAAHPDTARHLARKLLVHFIGPDPDPALITRMADHYLASGATLLSLYDVMLDSAAAWVPQPRKVKPPFDYIASALRALAVPETTLRSMDARDIRRHVQRPLEVMGQTWQMPLGPDGWPEADHIWATAQGMAGRITWAMRTPIALVDQLPDPRDFVYHALGPTPPDPVVFAAGATETRQDGIGVILASAAFQRR